MVYLHPFFFFLQLFPFFVFTLLQLDIWLKSVVKEKGAVVKHI